MSFGSLSGPAITALNKGAALAGTMHNTGEGGLSEYHRSGGDLVLQIGTSYFGCRNDDGTFNLDKLKAVVAGAPRDGTGDQAVPGRQAGARRDAAGCEGDPEIARIRGIPVGKDCASPGTAPSTTSTRCSTSWNCSPPRPDCRPIKSAVGDMGFWEELATLMARGDRGVDFVTIDGGEGGTGRLR